MRLEFTDEEQAFRQEVQSFLREQLSPDISDKVLNGYELGREDYLLWQRRLHDRGWGGMGWPVAFGGPGWNSVQQYIFEEESALAGGAALGSSGPPRGGAGAHGGRAHAPAARA